MVRPRKIPKNFVPVEWTDTDEDDVFQDDEVEIQVEEGDDLASDNEHDNEVDVQNPVENLQNPVENQPGNDGEEDDMDSDPELDQEFNSVEEPFQILAKKWLLIEMSHCVSKRASDKFWKAATTFFNPGTKIPSFTHLRRQLLKKKLSQCLHRSGLQKRRKWNDLNRIRRQHHLKFPISQTRIRTPIRNCNCQGNEEFITY